jgi:hypothetical protein
MSPYVGRRLGTGSVRRIVVLASGVLMVTLARSQSSVDTSATPSGWHFGEERTDFSLGALVDGLVTPRTVLDARRIRSYVRDPRFDKMRTQEGDVRAADAIFLRALRVADYDIGQALFLSLLAALEHRRLPLHIPLVGAVNLPLTFEEDSLFRARVRHLPTMLYPDSPKDDRGDRDKLQHFFGSAYVAYSSESLDLARTAGDVVEWGEAVVVVGGTDDPRDRKSNAQGSMFGHDLVYVKTMLPSDYLRLRVSDQ